MEKSLFSDLDTYTHFSVYLVSEVRFSSPYTKPWNLHQACNIWVMEPLLMKTTVRTIQANDRLMKKRIYSQANDSVSFLRFRRAHLKECFETLKKNVPNVDEKKTSNLSVLRSALRYIQVHLRHIFSAFPPVFNTPVRRDTIVWTLLATCFSSHCFHLSLVLNWLVLLRGNSTGFGPVWLINNACIVGRKPFCAGWSLVTMIWRLPNTGWISL